MSQSAAAHRASCSKFERIEVIPLSKTTGAEVRCGNLQSIDDATFREIYQAWLDHLVLLFRGQTITDAELIAFSKRFGPLELAPLGAAGQKSRDARKHPEIHVVSNVKENGRPIGILGDGEAMWHTDMSSFIQPPAASMLYALELPPSGGDTFFNNMYVAYETLPDEMKRRLIGLTLKHDALYNSAGERNVPDPVRQPGTGASHPIVCTHPETGYNALYLGRRAHTYINELPRAESDQLLDFLWAHSTQPQFVWRHQWRLGDVVVWDNRCLMHYREAFDPNTRRVLHRTQVQGSVKPYTAPDALALGRHPRAAAGETV
jgi:taurine dioxygenase